MPGMTACAAKNWCLRLTAMVRSQDSGVTSSTVWRVSLPAFFGDGLEGRLKGGDVGEVAGEEERGRGARVVEALDQALGRLGLEVEEGDFGVVGCEGLDNRGADSAGAAGDDDDAVVEAWIGGESLGWSHSVSMIRPCCWRLGEAGLEKL
jgi:hypothetical protein